MCFNNWQYIQAGFSNSSGLKVAHFQIIGSLNLMQSKSKNSEIEKKNMFHYLCTGFKQKQIIRGSCPLGSPDMNTVREHQDFSKQNIFHMDLICRNTGTGHRCECGDTCI